MLASRKRRTDGRRHPQHGDGARSAFFFGQLLDWPRPDAVAPWLEEDRCEGSPDCASTKSITASTRRRHVSLLRILSVPDVLIGVDGRQSARREIRSSKRLYARDAGVHRSASRWRRSRRASFTFTQPDVARAKDRRARRSAFEALEAVVIETRRGHRRSRRCANDDEHRSRSHKKQAQEAGSQVARSRRRSPLRGHVVGRMARSRDTARSLPSKRASASSTAPRVQLPSPRVVRLLQKAVKKAWDIRRSRRKRQVGSARRDGTVLDVARRLRRVVLHVDTDGLVDGASRRSSNAPFRELWTTSRREKRPQPRMIDRSASKAAVKGQPVWRRTMTESRRYRRYDKLVDATRNKVSDARHRDAHRRRVHLGRVDDRTEAARSSRGAPRAIRARMVTWPSLRPGDAVFPVGVEVRAFHFRGLRFRAAGNLPIALIIAGCAR